MGLTWSWQGLRDLGTLPLSLLYMLGCLCHSLGNTTGSRTPLGHSRDQNQDGMVPCSSQIPTTSCPGTGSDQGLTLCPILPGSAQARGSVGDAAPLPVTPRWQWVQGHLVWQGRVPDSRRLLLIGTPRTQSRSRQGIITSPQPISRNASLSWHKQPGTMAQHWLQDVALWGQTELGDTNDQGHAQAGDTRGQGVQPFGDMCGQGKSMSRVMCNEGTQPSWGHTWSGGACPWGDTAGGYIPPGDTHGQGSVSIGDP